MEWDPLAREAGSRGFGRDGVCSGGGLRGELPQVPEALEPATGEKKGSKR